MRNCCTHVRSLLCTSTAVTPHARFLSFPRRSINGKGLPEWLRTTGPVLLRKFVRSGKTDDAVQRVELTYARIRYSDGRECTVSLRDLARCEREEISLDEEIGMNDKDDNRYNFRMMLMINWIRYPINRTKVLIVRQIITYSSRENCPFYETPESFQKDNYTIQNKLEIRKVYK